MMVVVVTVMVTTVVVAVVVLPMHQRARASLGLETRKSEGVLAKREMDETGVIW